MKRMISAATSATLRHLKKDTLIYVALGIIIGLLISMNSPSPVTADSDSVARALRTLNSRLDTLNSHLGSIDNKLRRYNVNSVLYGIADELDDLESEMKRHR